MKSRTSNAARWRAKSLSRSQRSYRSSRRRSEIVSATSLQSSRSPGRLGAICWTRKRWKTHLWWPKNLALRRNASSVIVGRRWPNSTSSCIISARSKPSSTVKPHATDHCVRDFQHPATGRNHHCVTDFEPAVPPSHPDARVLIQDMKHPGDKEGNDVFCDLPPEATAIIDGHAAYRERDIPLLR